MYLQIECTHCHSLLSPKQINLASMQVECKRCGQKVSFTENTLVNISRKSKLSPPPGIHIEKKQGLLNIQVLWQNTLTKNKDHKSITNQQFTFLGITGLLFTSIFIQPSILVYTCTMLFFLLAFYYFIYRPFSLRNNQIQIKVNSQYLEIDSGQWPYFLAYGKTKFPVQDIQQLYIRKSKKKDLKNQGFYALCAVLKNRKTSPLIESLISPKVALFLEQEIEHFLKIK